MTTLLILAYLLLLACTSMYFGTGWSLMLFSIPATADLTPDDYFGQIVPQTAAATRFFTWMTNLMILLAIVMIVAEWGDPLWWVPWILLSGVAAATLLTVRGIFPLNKRLKEGVTDQVELDAILDRWKRLNLVRTGFWTLQWLAMAGWFGYWAAQAR